VILLVAAIKAVCVSVILKIKDDGAISQILSADNLISYLKELSVSRI
jgi:hypothetical protein